MLKIRWKQKKKEFSFAIYEYVDDVHSLKSLGLGKLSGNINIGLLKTILPEFSGTDKSSSLDKHFTSHDYVVY